MKNKIMLSLSLAMLMPGLSYSLVPACVTKVATAIFKDATETKLYGEVTPLTVGTLIVIANLANRSSGFLGDKVVWAYATAANTGSWAVAKLTPGFLKAEADAEKVLSGAAAGAANALASSGDDATDATRKKLAASKK